MRCPSLTELPPPPASTTVWPWTRASKALPDTMPDGRPWPLISIVTPSYNQGQYLEQAIRSVLLQGYPRLELIVMDGGSTDDTRAVLERYDPWLKHWSSGKDGGPTIALNRGFGYASGDLYGFLNADDFLLEGCLERIATEFAAHPEADVVSGHGYFAKESGDLGMPTYSDSWSFTRFSYGACVLLQPATFFRRQMFEQVHGFRERTSTVWDMELWADMALAGAQFRLVNAFMAAFRLHAGSITGGTANLDRRVNDAIAVMERLRGRPEDRRDRVLRLVHRLVKFSRHPQRTLRQRLFFHSTLKRWSL